MRKTKLQKHGRYAYKVLTGCRSGNGGKFDWSQYLPQNGKPGAWTPERDVALCSSGWHLTDEPHRWAGNRVFLAEYRGEVERDKNKICASSVRLIEEITEANCIDPSCALRIGIHPCLRGYVTDLTGDVSGLTGSVDSARARVLIFLMGLEVNT